MEPIMSPKLTYRRDTGHDLFLMKEMAPKEITLIDIYTSIVPFVIIMLFGLAMVMLFPQIAMWLPEFFMENDG